MLTSAQLEAAMLTAAEIGPRWGDVQERWTIPEPDGNNGTRCGRILLGILEDGIVYAFIELRTLPTSPPAEAAAAAMRRRWPLPDPRPLDIHVGEVMDGINPGAMFTPTGFGDDAVAIPATGLLMIERYPAKTLVVVWNKRDVQATVGSVNYSPPPLSGNLTFDGLKLAEQQRDKLRALLPE